MFWEEFDYLTTRNVLQYFSLLVGFKAYFSGYVKMHTVKERNLNYFFFAETLFLTITKVLVCWILGCKFLCKIA